MKPRNLRYAVLVADIVVLLQATVLGFLLAELSYFGSAVGEVFSAALQTAVSQRAALAACLVTASILVAYVYLRGGFSHFRRFWNGNRLDFLTLGVCLSLGWAISATIGGVGTATYKEYVGHLGARQLLLICAIPITIILSLLIRAISQRKSHEAPPFFINDEAINNKENDLLGLAEPAARFAESVLNRGSSDSLVFGIDAPWGIGKSSFVNFCCEYWRDKADSQTIVHRFEPLRYRNDVDLVEKFVTELVDSIQQKVFVPSIRPLFANYLRHVQGKKSLSVFGVGIELGAGSGSVEQTLKTLEVRLAEWDRKIVVIVDDLDRLAWVEIKNILFAIKRSFTLPNVSYILCYDTTNLTLTKNENENVDYVREFLEKFVNVKISLLYDADTLADFVSLNIKEAINNNLQLDARLLDQIKQALEALVDIYRSQEYPYYQEFLGDVRKLKRLINTMMLFEIQTTDFENSDFNKKDLVNLLLIYINYPNIFRKIYNAEIGGKSSFFSLVWDHGKAGAEGRFVNSRSYENYQKDLTESQKFLLDSVFKAPNEGEAIETSDRTSRACFSGNLERYLKLIVKLSKQDKREGYQFYVNKKSELLKGVSLEKIFESEDFSFAEGDFTRAELWKVISNSAHELSPIAASDVVVYLMDNIPDYSLIKGEQVGAGSRHMLIYALMKILDVAAWGANSEGRRDNSEKNIAEIAEWVFGEGRHAGSGVIATLAKPDRGALGLSDLLLFRLYCSADRGSSLFNLQRAIALHGNPAAPTSGLTIEIAKEGMREISQVVFQVFREQYIDPKKNFLEEVDSLCLDDLAGKSSKFVEQVVQSEKVTKDRLDELLAIQKSAIKIFAIYQLGNSLISSGVGCGFYDETGNADEKGIARRINDYLFQVCFNPEISKKNYELFLDYLLASFGRTWEEGFVPNVEEITKVLDAEQLKTYWRQHRNEVQDLHFESSQKSIYTSNYVATYSTDLPVVYGVLDEFCSTRAVDSDRQSN